MFKIFNELKNKLKSDSQPQYRQYTHPELKLIAIRTRLLFQQLYKKQSLQITQGDSQFKKVQASQAPLSKQYEVLQQIGHKVIEVETIKLLIQILRKIQSSAPQIINTRGDITFCAQQIKWFQLILWFRKCKKLTNIEQFFNFCWNFFKGVDITSELKINCELFKVFEGMQYLEQGEIMPLDYIVEKVTPFVSFMIEQKELEEMKKINQQEIKKKSAELKMTISLKQNAVNSSNTINPNINPSYNNPNLPYHNSSNFPYHNDPLFYNKDPNLAYNNPKGFINNHNNYFNNSNPLMNNQKPYFNNYDPHLNNQSPCHKPSFNNQNLSFNNPNSSFNTLNPNFNSFDPSFNPLDPNFSINNTPFNPISPSFNNLNNSNPPLNSQTPPFYNPNPVLNNQTPHFNNPNPVLNNQTPHFNNPNPVLNKQTPHFNSPLPFQQEKKNFQGNYDEFAINRFSRTDNNKNSNIDSIPTHLPPYPVKEKSFKSPNLNLVDWQSMYRKDEQNPYIYDSKIGLLSQQHSLDQNTYDEKSLPYPPSGLVSGTDYRKQNEKDKFYFDTLEKYQPQPVNVTEDSFIRKIQNQFLSKNNNPKTSYDFKQQDLLKELERQNKNESLTLQPKKSFGKLFGMKFKKTNEQGNLKNEANLLGSIVNPVENQGSQRQNESILDILSQTEGESSHVKKLNSEDLQLFLNSFNQNLNVSKSKNKKEPRRQGQSIQQVQDDLQYMNIDVSSEQQQKEQQKLDQQINFIIESRKEQICGQNAKNISNQEQVNKLNILNITSQNINKDLNQNINQRFQDSTLRYFNDQENESQYLNHNKENFQQFISKQNNQKQADYSYFYYGFQRDLLDSLNIIKQYFGQDLISPSSTNQTIIDPQAQSKKSIKKPYMVSIYAREEFMNMVNSRKPQ